MRQAFHQYFSLPKDTLAQLWKDGLFSFDASVLLNVYGYSAETAEELISLLEKISDRVKVTHQFGLEFSRKRCVVILKQVKNYLTVEKSLGDIQKVNLAPKREHPFLSQESLKALEKIKSELAERRKKMERLIGNDQLATRILKIFEGKVGVAPTNEELVSMHADIQQRYDNLVPPGFADLKDKGIPDAYGDCIGWLQLMSIAHSEKRGLIFVTDDFKEDWWRIEYERTVAARPELIAEFANSTNQSFHMYTSEKFLLDAKEYLDLEIGAEAIDEVSSHVALLKSFFRATQNKSISEKAVEKQDISKQTEVRAKDDEEIKNDPDIKQSGNAEVDIPKKSSKEVPHGD